MSATASPKTGDVTGIPLIALAVAGLTAVFARKKK
ncbi:MAG: NPXTG-anchored protein [Oscillospiraceae bacterium]|nr:NPXTG-anchored protein [Oscillospiraceae bacterium]